MLSKEVCSTVTFSRESLCNSARELLQSKDFYFLMELYCNRVSDTEQKKLALLDYYFNDEGYVDCWRIPHLMLDIHEQKYQFHANTLESPEFLPFFFDFLLGFYNYCMTVYQPFLVGDWAFRKERDAMLNISICRHQMNLIMDTFSRIIANIDSYKTSEGGH